MFKVSHTVQLNIEIVIKDPRSPALDDVDSLAGVIKLYTLVLNNLK